MVTFFGFCVKLEPGSGTGIGVEFRDNAICDISTFFNRFTPYSQFCRIVSGWNITRDESLTPYAYHENNWVTYDDINSLEIKTRFAMDMGLAGMHVWPVDLDDFTGICHGIKFPLLKAIIRILNQNG